MRLNSSFVKNQTGDISPLSIMLSFAIVMFAVYVLKGFANPDQLHERHYALVREAAAAATLQVRVDGYGNACIDPDLAKREFTKYLMLNFGTYKEKITSWRIEQDMSQDLFFTFNPAVCSIGEGGQTGLVPTSPNTGSYSFPANFHIRKMNAMQWINQKSIAATVWVEYSDGHHMEYSVVQSIDRTPWDKEFKTVQ